MRRKNEKFEKDVEDLIRLLHDDLQSTIPPEQRKYKGVSAESLIWNLFYGKNYKFSFAMFREVLKRLKDDVDIEKKIDC
jgi:hypothetical protein